MVGFSINRFILCCCFTFFLAINICLGQSEKADVTVISKKFVENIVSGNMLQNLDFIVVDSNTGKDSAIASFEGMRYRIMNEFGKDVKITSLGYNQAVLLMGSARVQDHFDGLKYSYVQIEDKNRFSVFQLSFAGDKIVDFGMLNEIYAKPDTQKMWFIGIPILLLVLSFNIFVIFKVYKSNVTRKWIKYMMIACLNLPTIGMSSIGGFFFRFISIRAMGIGVGWGNYFNTYWAVGIPLGGIVVLWRLSSNLYRTKDDDWIYDVSNEGNI